MESTLQKQRFNNNQHNSTLTSSTVESTFPTDNGPMFRPSRRDDRNSGVETDCNTTRKVSHYSPHPLPHKTYAETPKHTLNTHWKQQKQRRATTGCLQDGHYGLTPVRLFVLLIAVSVTPGVFFRLFCHASCTSNVKCSTSTFSPDHGITVSTAGRMQICYVHSHPDHWYKWRTALILEVHH